VSGFEVTADGTGVVGHAGAALLAELADRLGLPAALSWRTGQGQTRRHRHQAGRVLGDLAVLLADGGDCLSDLAVLRNQPELFGPCRVRGRSAGRCRPRWPGSGRSG
jgi:Transposase DDE domain group 1